MGKIVAPKAVTAISAFAFTAIRRNDTIERQADVAQLVEQLIRNQQVVSSSLTVGSRIRQENRGDCGVASRNREVIFIFGARRTDGSETDKLKKDLGPLHTIKPSE